jgi:hypothetical protein
VDFLASHFQKGVYDAYFMSPRPSPTVFRLKDCEDPCEATALQIADVARRRKRSLEFSVRDILFFRSPLDGIELMDDCILGDLNFATKASRKTSSCLELRHTQDWQHRCLTEFPLHHGIIRWTDATHRLTSSGRYPAQTFRKPLRKMGEGNTLSDTNNETRKTIKRNGEKLTRN